VNDFVELLPVIALATSEGAIRENPVVCGVDISRTVLEQSVVWLRLFSDN
jgi:hypothetical protein